MHFPVPASLKKIARVTVRMLYLSASSASQGCSESLSLNMATLATFARSFLQGVSHAFRYHFVVRFCVALFVLGSMQGTAAAQSSRPILISEADSTRAIALETTALTTQPFSPTTPSFFYGTDQRTRIMLFVMNLSLQPGEDLSALIADAEDGTHHHYSLRVEELRPVAGQEWLSQLVLRLDDSLGDVGDVLVSVVYRNVASNRVRVGIGHFGNGLPDDAGAVPTPAAQHYKISGRITSGSTGLGGVLVTLSGTRNETITTDNSGAYSFTVPAYGDYSLTPAKDFYSFAPASRTFNNLGANQTADFQATPITFTISGQVKDEENKPLSGATLTLGGSQQATATTDANGNYSFTNLTGGGNFTVAIAKPNYSFNPVSQAFNNLSSNQTLNFSGILDAYTISGRIAESNSNGLPNVLVTISDSAASRTVMTNESGLFTIAVKAHGNYTVTPSARFFDFNPQKLVFNLLSADQTAANFIATRRLHTINGQVLDDQGQGLAGVPVTLKSSAANAAPRVTGTGSGSSFSFADVPAGFDYTVSPSSTSLYDFAAQSASALDGNLSLTFKGTRRKYSISGLVTDGKSGLDGIYVTLTGGNNLSPLTLATSGGGKFSFPNLNAGYSYTVTPTSSVYYNVSNAQTVQNLISDEVLTFTGTQRSYTVSGLVTDENNNPLSGSTVLLYNGNSSINRVASTGGNGRYQFADVPAGNSYTVGPSNTPTHSFTNQIVNGLAADSTLNFQGVRRYYTISGVIADRSNQPVGGVSVTLSGAVNSSTMTDANGSYSFGNLPSEYAYQLNVAKTDYIFDPSFRAVNLYQDEKANFTAIRTYRISGHVRDGSGHGLAGMTMTLSGAETGKQLTGSDGFYSFTVTTNGDYLLTPSKEQDFYIFAPANRSFNNLNAHQTADFVGTFSPPTSPTYVLEFNGTPGTVDYRRFWPEGQVVGHFFWEFWAMPGQDTYTRYLISDGYGAAHTVLFGFNYGIDGHYNLFGNIFDGTKANYYGSDEGPGVGEWGHYAVGWDGKSLITYYDGVPVGKQPFAGPRFSPGVSWGQSWLLIGGSDHQNLIGRIAQVRAYEDNNPRESAPESTFTPQTVFSQEGQFLSYYFRPSQTVADLSAGYNGSTHPGTLRGIDFGYTIDCPTCDTPHFVLDPTAPDFANPANPGQVNVTVDAPPAAPGGALVFDSFSRNNSTYILGGKGGLGSTEADSAGAQTWQTNLSAGELQPFGILAGHAVLLANDAAVAWVSTGASTGDLDVRVDRTLGNYGSGHNTGLSFRVLDKNNFFFAYTSDDPNNPAQPKKLWLGYYHTGASTFLLKGLSMPSSSWKTLRVLTTQAGGISVYADKVQVYSTTSQVFASATGAGLFNNAAGLSLTNRWDNFTVFSAP
jgi:hypothetical protein